MYGSQENLNVHFFIPSPLHDIISISIFAVLWGKIFSILICNSLTANRIVCPFIAFSNIYILVLIFFLCPFLNVDCISVQIFFTFKNLPVFLLLSLKSPLYILDMSFTRCYLHIFASIFWVILTMSFIQQRFIIFYEAEFAIFFFFYGLYFGTYLRTVGLT